MTYLAVPISGENVKKAKQQIKTAKVAGAELLELRTDYLEELSTSVVETLIKACRPLPVIVTCRDVAQGGARAYPSLLRVGVLAAAIYAGAEFVDLEYENFLPAQNQEKILVALAKHSRTRLILSVHNFRTRFESITRINRDILSVYPAAIPKLVYTANHINDCFEAFDLLRQSGGERIAFCMGQAGLISRIIAKKMGSLVTFASIDDKSATAPGQLTIEELKETYRFDKIDSDTELYGVMGSPVGHSLGPVVHNKCFSKMRANKLYLPIQLDGGKEEFETFMQKIIARRWLHFRGFSITLPHKQNALSFVRKSSGVIESLAAKIDAANTLLVDRHGKVSAYNTDYAGALEAITSTLKITNAKLAGFNVSVIGAGGVARAVVAGLSDTGATITIYNRTVERGRNLADEFDCDFKPLDELPGINAELLINCTSIGMHPDVKHSPLSKKYLRKGMAVFDTVYNPAQTLLLKSAADKGAKTVDGLSMFVSQAGAQFKLFTGQQANTRFMRKTVSDCMARK